MRSFLHQQKDYCNHNSLQAQGISYPASTTAEQLLLAFEMICQTDGDRPDDFGTLKLDLWANISSNAFDWEMTETYSTCMFGQLQSDCQAKALLATHYTHEAAARLDTLASSCGTALPRPTIKRPAAKPRASSSRRYPVSQPAMCAPLYSGTS